MAQLHLKRGRNIKRHCILEAFCLDEAESYQLYIQSRVSWENTRSTNMDSLPRPEKALMPARGADDRDELVQTRYLILEQAYFESIRQRLSDFLFSSSLQNRPVLPTINTPLDGVSTPPPLKDTTVPGRTTGRHKSVRNDETRGSEPTPPQSDDGVSNVHKRRRFRVNKNGKKVEIDPSVTPRTRHKDRVDCLRSVLNPMLAGDKPEVVLLCWGEKSNCTISPIKISNSENEENTWREIHEDWYSRKGHWRKDIPGFNVVGIDVVQVCRRFLFSLVMAINQRI